MYCESITIIIIIIIVTAVVVVVLTVVVLIFILSSTDCFPLKFILRILYGPCEGRR